MTLVNLRVATRERIIKRLMNTPYEESLKKFFSFLVRHGGKAERATGKKKNERERRWEL